MWSLIREKYDRIIVLIKRQKKIKMNKEKKH